MLRSLMGILVLAAAIAGLAAWGMGGSTPQAAKNGASALQVQDASAATRTPAKARALPHGQALPAAPAAAKAPARATSIAATRGRSWVSVRVGGPTGRILFQAILQRGRKLHYTLGPRLWVRMGRPGNVDILLGAARVGGLPAQPGNVLLTRSGARPA
jgi:hypothetical protein